jgi:hypothetical protein
MDQVVLQQNEWQAADKNRDVNRLGKQTTTALMDQSISEEDRKSITDDALTAFSGVVRSVDSNGKVSYRRAKDDEIKTSLGRLEKSTTAGGRAGLLKDRVSKGAQEGDVDAAFNKLENDKGLDKLGTDEKNRRMVVLDLLNRDEGKYDTLKDKLLEAVGSKDATKLQDTLSKMESEGGLGKEFVTAYRKGTESIGVSPSEELMTAMVRRIMELLESFLTDRNAKPQAE